MMNTKSVGQGIAIRLAEKDGKEDIKNIQIFKAGEYHHEWYGALQLSAAIFLAMIANFDAKVYGIDIMIDYNHDRENAAGWIKRLYMNEDQTELWAEADWTPGGEKDITEKNYRYFSGDFHYNHVDNETGAEHGPLLYGAALTNRPFIKGMAPTTELNETGGKKMTLQQLQDENKKLTEQVAAVTSLKDAELAKVSKEASDAKAEVVKLAEQVKTLAESNAKAQKESEFAVLLSEGKAVPAQKDAFLTGDMAAFAKAAGTLNLSTKGTGKETQSTETPSEDDKEDKILKLAEEKFAKGGFVSMGDAISAAKKELA